MEPPSILYKRGNDFNMKRLAITILCITVFLLLGACSALQSVFAVSSTVTPSSDQSKPIPEPSASTTPTAMPTPTAVPTPTLNPIDMRISQMSIRELIGQMVMIGFTGTDDVDSDSVQIIQDYSIGNVILFGWNTETFEQTQELIQAVNSYNASDIPLLIGIDVEGGSVTRFKGQWKPFINSAQKLGQINDPDRVYEQYKHIGTQLKEIGINIDFAPVLDIAHDPSSTFLGNRMFGSDPETVSVLIRAAIKGLHDGGIASLGKHFPGHGDTASDSHETLPVINATLEQAQSYALAPFQAAVDEDIDAILVAHLSYPNIDSQYITSVSPAVITDILRKTMGFEGVVFSDDMRMRGLRSQYTVGEGAVLHILAGGDIVLIGKYADMQKDVLDTIYQAFKDGRITRERLEQSVRRILNMKRKYTDTVF